MTELIVILVVALLVIGPNRLPDLAKTLGRALRDFKRATSEFQDSLSLDEEVADSYVREEDRPASSSARGEESSAHSSGEGGHSIDPGPGSSTSSAPSGSAEPDEAGSIRKDRAE